MHRRQGETHPSSFRASSPSSGNGVVGSEERDSGQIVGYSKLIAQGCGTRGSVKVVEYLLTGKNCEWAQNMSGKRVEEIERVIGTLTQEELEELRVWLDEYAGPGPLDRRIGEDLVAGRRDGAVQSALDDEKRGRVRPL